MSYGRTQNPHVTMLDELPELEDLEAVGNHNVPLDRHIMERPNPQDDRYQKHIRGTHRLNPQAGMEGYGAAPAQEMIQEHVDYPQRMQMQMAPPPMTMNCIDIARHIQDCPICSKFYQNDKTVYIIAIVVLSIVCLLLLKRVLNV